MVWNLYVTGEENNPNQLHFVGWRYTEPAQKLLPIPDGTYVWRYEERRDPEGDHISI